MSLPRQPPSHSSSPTKPALRRPSGPQNPPTARALLPSPHFEEPLAHLSYRSPPQPNLEYEEAIEEETGSLAESFPASTSPPLFRPFFTLVHDTVTGTHHHPTVHYIFADDDAEIITEAACRALVQDDPSMASSAAPVSGASSAGRSAEDSKLPPSHPHVRENYLILDVLPTTVAATEEDPSTTSAATTVGARGPSYKVTQAHSLSSEWQILETRISAAPSLDSSAAAAGGGPGDDGEEDALMLRISGRGAAAPSFASTPPAVLAAAAAEHKMGSHPVAAAKKETVEEMVERFKKGLIDLRRTVQLGEDLLLGDDLG